MEQKQLILNKALELFNQRGTNNVSTNLIGEELAINPGVFYEYFENKEDILLQLFEQMTKEWESDTYQLNSVLLTEDVVMEMLDKTGSFFAKYSFFFKELSCLLHHSEKLRKANSLMQTKRLNELYQMVDFNIAQGVLRPLNNEEKEFFANMLWMGSLFWKPYVEMIKQNNYDQKNKEILAHFKLLFQLFKT